MKKYKKLFAGFLAFALILSSFGQTFVVAGESDFTRGMNGRFGSSLVDFAGRQSYNTIFGEQVVGGRIDDISIQFQYSNSTNDLVIGTPTGTGGQSNAESMMRVSAGTGIGTQNVESRDSIRYRPGHESMTQFTGRFVGAQQNVRHTLGVGNTDDRVSFGTQNGIFGVWFKEGGNETFTPQSSFINDTIDGSTDVNNTSGFDIIEENLNIYMVTYGWLGNAPVLYFVYGGSKLGWVLVHTIDETNTGTEPHLQNPTLPMVAEVIRTSGVSQPEAFLETSSWRAGVVSSTEMDNASNRWFPFFNIDVAVSGVANTGTHLLTLRSKATFQSKTNHVKSNVKVLITTSSHNKDLLIVAIPTAILRAADGTFAGLLDAGYNDVNTANSVTEVSKPAALTVDVTTITEDDFADVALIQALRSRENLDVQGFNIYPNDEISFIVMPPGTGTGDVSLQGNFRELF